MNYKDKQVINHDIKHFEIDKHDTVGENASFFISEPFCDISQQKNEKGNVDLSKSCSFKDNNTNSKVQFSHLKNQQTTLYNQQFDDSYIASSFLEYGNKTQDVNQEFFSPYFSSLFPQTEEPNYTLLESTRESAPLANTSQCQGNGPSYVQYSSPTTDPNTCTFKVTTPDSMSTEYSKSFQTMLQGNEHLPSSSHSIGVTPQDQSPMSLSSCDFGYESNSFPPTHYSNIPNSNSQFTTFIPENDMSTNTHFLHHTPSTFDSPVSLSPDSMPFKDPILLSSHHSLSSQAPHDLNDVSNTFLSPVSLEIPTSSSIRSIQSQRHTTVFSMSSVTNHHNLAPKEVVYVPNSITSNSSTVSPHTTGDYSIDELISQSISTDNWINSCWLDNLVPNTTTQPNTTYPETTSSLSPNPSTLSVLTTQTHNCNSHFVTSSSANYSSSTLNSCQQAPTKTIFKDNVFDSSSIKNNSQQIKYSTAGRNEGSRTHVQSSTQVNLQSFKNKSPMLSLNISDRADNIESDVNGDLNPVLCLTPVTPTSPGHQSFLPFFSKITNTNESQSDLSYPTTKQNDKSILNIDEAYSQNGKNDMATSSEFEKGRSRFDLEKATSKSSQYGQSWNMPFADSPLSEKDVDELYSKLMEIHDMEFEIKEGSHSSIEFDINAIHEKCKVNKMSC